MNKDDFFTAISEMESRLKSDTGIVLLNFHVFPPAEEDYITMVAEKHQLPEEFLSFYKFTNGLQVRWISKKNDSYNPKKHQWAYGPFFTVENIASSTEYYGDWDGSINILPLEIMFETSWKGTTWRDKDKDRTMKIGGKELNAFEFLSSLRPFDMYSEDSTVHLVLSDDPDFRLKFLKSIDVFADFQSSKFLSFTMYMEHLFANNGSVDCRAVFDLY